MSWTDDRVELLKKLWGQGKTASEIATILGGVTRNAVIGKAHRLKLSSRISPIQQNKKKKKAEPQKVIRIEEANIPVKRVAMVELTEKMCRWPLGDPREKEFHFCGCRSVPGLPYCADHAKIAYHAAARRALNAEDFEDKAMSAEDNEEKRSNG